VEERGGPSGEAVPHDAEISASTSFEDARAELERIVTQLESGEAPLEDAIALWERGERLYRHCVAKLDAAQGRVEELGRDTAGDTTENAGD
jgi:exodeoxyribonuclease VII small subunit